MHIHITIPKNHWQVLNNQALDLNNPIIFFSGTDATWTFSDPQLFVSSATDYPSQETYTQMIHTEDLNDLSITMVTASIISDATTEGQKEQRLLFPQFTNAVVLYGFPSILVVGLVSNVLSVVTIVNSSIRQTSTGLYLCVLAAVDSVTLYLWTSTVPGRSRPGSSVPTPSHLPH